MRSQSVRHVCFAAAFLFAVFEQSAVAAPSAASPTPTPASSATAVDECDRVAQETYDWCVESGTQMCTSNVCDDYFYQDIYTTCSHLALEAHLRCVCYRFLEGSVFGLGSVMDGSGGFEMN